MRTSLPEGTTRSTATRALACLGAELERSTLLSEEEAACYLHLSPATLKKWRRTRRGPRYYRLGSAIRYRVDDLETFLSESAENPRNPRHDEKGDR